MPYKTRKVRGKDCYRVYNRKTKRLFAKCSTKENAKKQMNLLRAIQNNKNFIPLASLNRIKKSRTNRG
jgi:NADH:ubiquinone oxidoreductase subunit E